MGEPDFDYAGVRKTFGLRSPYDMLEKLRWERTLAYDLGGTDTLKATFCLVNAFTTAWHLAEWAWHAMDEGSRSIAGQETMEEYRANVRRRCPELAFCDQVANAAKHGRRDGRRNDPAVWTKGIMRMTFKMRDGRSLPFGMRLGFNPTVRDAEVERDALEIIDVVIEFWRAELDTLEAASVSNTRSGS